MIGLDTNIIVRYLVQDDPAQSRKATALIDERLTADEPGYLGVVVIAEIAWVLERGYRLDSSTIAATIERLLQTEVFVIEHEREVFAAMIAVREDHASFADALIAACAIGAGCRRTLTFDRRAARMSGVELL